MSKWIKTEDELPPMYQPVLLIRDDEIMIGNLTDNEYEVGPPCFRCDFFDLEIKEVKHWMPLPPMPEELKDEQVD